MTVPAFEQGSLFDYVDPPIAEPELPPESEVEEEDGATAIAAAEADGQARLWPDDEDWRALWVGMPEFVQEDLEPYRTVLVHVATPEDLAALAAALGQKIANGTRYTPSVWYPAAEIGRIADKAYGDE